MLSESTYLNSLLLPHNLVLQKSYPFKSKTRNIQNPSPSLLGDKEKFESVAEKDPLAVSVWRLYTKAKDTMADGERLENLVWRA
ncbi:8265_t:CDS:1, partial [Ambispora leptoticha]